MWGDGERKERERMGMQMKRKGEEKEKRKKEPLVSQSTAAEGTTNTGQKGKKRDA